MLAVIAAVLFAIAFIINAAAISTSAVFSATSLALAGLVLLALQIAGFGPAWSAPRRRRR
jgi:hypothetical protein